MLFSEYLMKNIDCSIAIGYEPKLEFSINKIFKDSNVDFFQEYDAMDDFSMMYFFENLAKKWESFDIIINGIAFFEAVDSDKYINTSRENFRKSMDITCYAFTKTLFFAKDLMKFGGVCLGFTAYGARKHIDNYNVLGVAKAALESSVRYLAAELGPVGIRINLISCAFIRTSSAYSLKGFRKNINWQVVNAPIQRALTHDDILYAALFLLSDYSSYITGEIMNLDGGYNILGAKNRNSLDMEVN